MKMTAIALGLTLALGAQAQDLDTEEARVSYKLGMDMGAYVQSLELAIDPDIVAAAIRDVTAGRDARLGPEAYQEIGQMVKEKENALREARMAEMNEQRTMQGEKNKTEGAAFLAENAGKDNITVTDSGLQYEVIRGGDGAKPAATDTVKVHYRGTLLDGTEFDSSYARNQPAQFALNRVIAGWTEGLQLMAAGSQYRFYIPSELAYGERGAGAQIGPNAVLVFDVELLEIVDA